MPFARTPRKRDPRSSTSSRNVQIAARCAAEALEARRLLSVVPTATLYQEWLAAPADFKAAVAQVEARYPNFRARFESDLAILSGTFIGPLQFGSTVADAQPAVAATGKTKHHAHAGVARPKPAPRHRKHHNLHRDQPTISVTAPSYDWTHANHTLTFTFSADVSASLANPGALTVLNLSTGNTIPSSSITHTYANNIATYSIPYTLVADGNYQATLSSAIIQDPQGDHLAADYVFTSNFFFVTGDFNHDGYNNLTDLNTIGQYYGTTNATYAQGDANYDGTVGFADMIAEAQTYHETVNLPVPTGLSSPTQTPTTALLIWQAATSTAGNPAVSGYNVYRTTTANGTQTAGTNVPSTAFLDTGLAQQTNYTYTLRTTDSAADISLPSHPPLSVTTPAPTASNGGTNGGSGGPGNIGFDTTPPDAPTNLQVDSSYPAI